MIYFIQDNAVHHIKIGFTDKDPMDRMRALLTGSPLGLELLCTVDGTRATESELHLRFAEHRVHGEWFKPAPAIVRFIIEERARQVDLGGIMRQADVTMPEPDEVVCPVCNDRYVHIADCQSGDGEVSIQFWCENHWHQFEVTYHFHEGNTTRSVCRLADLPRCPA